MMNETERSRCATTARLLEAAGAVAHWSLVVSVTAFFLLAGGYPQTYVSILGCVIAVLIGLPERYFAFRLRFDAGLFKDLALGTITSLTALDEALNEASLRRRAGPIRSLEKRLSGARQLINRHGALVVCQSLALTAALLNQWLD